MAKTLFHPAIERGAADHGWLNSKHSFSFSRFYDPEKIHFGALRVLNDDWVAPGMGFGAHPHDNMEIISIPLKGKLVHKDSMGNEAVIQAGDIQVMSAGTGITHSEFNGSKTEPVEFLQIWLFPNQQNVAPRYDQVTIKEEEMLNHFLPVLAPSPIPNGVWIHQNAWFHLARFEAGYAQNYSFKNTQNGLYVFVLEGSISVEGKTLNQRDALGIWDASETNIQAIDNAKFLLMEIPMQLN